MKKGVHVQCAWKIPISPKLEKPGGPTVFSKRENQDLEAQLPLKEGAPRARRPKLPKPMISFKVFGAFFVKKTWKIHEPSPMEGKEANGGRVVAASPPRKKEIKNERRGADSQPPPRKKERKKERRGRARTPSERKKQGKKGGGASRTPPERNKGVNRQVPPQKERNK